MSIIRPIRPVVALCAVTALCCALLSGPAPAEASSQGVFKLATKAVTLVGKKSGSVLKETLKIFVKHPVGTVATGIGVTMVSNPEVLAKPLETLAQTPGEVATNLGREGIESLNQKPGGFPLLPVLVAGLGALALYLRYRVRCKALERADLS